MAEGSRRFDPTPTQELPEDRKPLPSTDLPQVSERDPNETSFSRSVESGVEQTVGSFQGTVAAGAAAVGAEDYALSMARKAAASFERSAELAPPIRDINQVKDGDTLVSYLTGLVGTQAPVVASLFAGGPAALGARGLAIKLGSTAAKRVSTKAALAAGTVAGGTALETGSIFHEALEQPADGTSLQKIGLTSLGFGTVAGGLEALPVVQVADRLGVGRTLRNQIKEGLGKRVAKGATATAVTEGMTEAAQTVVERSALKFLNDNFEVFSPEGRNEILNATVAGAILGGGFGAISGLPSPSTQEDGSPNRFTDRLDELEAEDEQIQARGVRAANDLKTVPGFTGDGATLADDFNFDGPEEAVRLSRKFGLSTPVENIIKGNAVDAAKVTPVHIEAIRRIANGEIALTPEIRAHLEPLFPTFRNGESTLDSMLESLTERGGSPDIGEGETLFEITPEFSTGSIVDESTGELLEAAPRALAGESGQVDLKQLGSLKPEFTTRPDAPTSAQVRAAKLNADKRNNVEASLVSVFDVILEHKREQGLSGEDLNAALDEAAAEQLTAAKARATTTEQANRIQQLFDSAINPRDFLKNFEAVSKRKRTSSAIGPLDFTNDELDRVHRPVFKGQLGDSQFKVKGSSKAIDAAHLVRIALQKVGIDPSEASTDQIASAFFDGITSLRTPASQADAVVPPNNADLATEPSSINKKTVVHFRKDGSTVTFGEILETGSGRARAKQRALIAEKAELPAKISSLEKLGSLTPAQTTRLNKLRERQQKVDGDIEVAANEIGIAADAAEAQSLSEKLRVEQEREREVRGTPENSSPDELGGPPIDPRDIPIADKSRIHLDDVEETTPVVGRKQRGLEDSYVEEIGRRLEINIKLRHVRFDPSDTTFAYSDARTNTIVLDASISDKALRIELIAHEIGHLYLNQITERELTSSEQALYDAMDAEFSAWRAKARDLTVDKVVHSKKAFRSAVESMADINGDVKVAELSEEERTYLLDFHEWFADNVAKWATTSKAPRTLLERFFLKIFKSLNAIFFEASELGYRTSQSFENFMNAVVKTKITRRQLKAAALDDASKGFPKNIRKQRRLVMGAGLAENDMFTEEASMNIHSIFTKELTPEERRVLINAFTNGSTRTALLKKLEPYPEHREEAIRDPMVAAVYGFQLWSAGELTVGPQTQGLMQSIGRQFTEVMGVVREHEQALQILNAIRNGAINARTAGTGSFAIRSIVQKTVIQRGAKNMGRISDAIFPLMSSVLSSASSRIRAFDNPFLTQLVKEFYVAVGDVGVNRAYFESRNIEIARWQNIAVRALHKDLTEAQIKEVDAAMKNSKIKPTDPAAKKAVAQLRRMFSEMLDYARDAGLDVGDASTKISSTEVNYFPRVWDVSKLSKGKYIFLSILNQQKYDKHLEGLANQFGRDKLTKREVMEEIFKTLIQSDGYGDIELDPDRTSHIPFAASVNKRTLSFLEEEDIAQFMSDDTKTTVLTYITQMVKRAEFVRRFGKKGQRIEDLLDQAAHSGATPEQLDAAEAFIHAMQGTYGLQAHGDAYKSIQDIRDAHTTDGSVVDRLLATAQDLAAQDSKTVSTVNSVLITWQNVRLLGLATMSSFVDLMGPAMRGDFQSAWEGYRAGASAMFTDIRSGAAGKRKADLLEIAEALGIVNEEFTNQALAWEFGTAHMSKQARVINDTFFKYTGLTAWTRMTRLMATASAEAWLIRQKHSPGDHTDRWLSELNISPADITLNENGRIKILTRRERVAATKAELARDDRIRTAMVRWVDGAILRPNAAQRPIWASSPAWQLVFHLKGFLYSAHETWLKRAVNELGNNNVMPLIYMMGMMPIMAASDWMRDRIQNWGEPAPRKANWGFSDHMWNSAERAGMFGLGQLILDMGKDAQYNGLISILDFGAPTSDQIGLLTDIIAGDESGERLPAFYESLPAQSIWGDWPFVR